jgi:septal ring factor EnvC (AmiA/AmiB activator)
MEYGAEPGDRAREGGAIDRRRGGKGGVGLDLTLSLGAILQAGLVATGLVMYIVGYTGKTDEVAKQLVEIKTAAAAQATAQSADMQKRFDDVQRQISAQQTDTGKHFDEVARQIAGLPDQSARLGQAESRLTRMEGTISALDAHIQTVERMGIENRADIATLVRSSAAPVRSPR